jgi:hypothetical protein
MAQKKKKALPTWRPNKEMKAVAKLAVWKSLKSRYDEGVLYHLVNKTQFPDKTACAHAVNTDLSMAMETTDKKAKKQCTWCLKVRAAL